MTTTSLESIRALVQQDLEATHAFIGCELESDIPLIKELFQYILSCGGKRIRPMLVLLSAKAFHYQERGHITLAAVIELIHTATLLHDDVVDNSTLRRGRQTAHTIWGSQASVLVGDFLYSRAFQLVVKQHNPFILKLFADATSLIAEGEVMQLMNCYLPDTTEQAYFSVIERKTAKLFEVAAQIGAGLSSATQIHTDAMQQYGKNLGIAYQLIDDALDYHASTAETGKNLGNDLAEGKPTLPLIFAMQKGSKAENELIRHAIQTGSCNNLSDIINIIESTGAIEYTANAAKQHAIKANAALQTIPESPYREALCGLAEFVVHRSY